LPPQVRAAFQRNVSETNAEKIVAQRQACAPARPRARRPHDSAPGA
jgi:hypothetical protein